MFTLEADGAGVEPCPVLSFAALLRTLRRSRGLTQEGLAQRAALSARAISDLERFPSRAPRRSTLDLVCAALACSPDQTAQLQRAASTRRTGRMHAQARRTPCALTLSAPAPGASVSLVVCAPR